jgi:site-specific DNA recombinase
LEQEFNTLDAQRESASAYIASQRHEGWVEIETRYDDGGFTGGNMDRPALKQLLADIKAGLIDCVVVYKVDRLSRSLLDFSRIMETLDAADCSFVSVTQQFNTCSSMGRLTLNILLSFAQFEREIISERTRDKMGAARRKGKYIGGRPILGYDVDRATKRLIVNESEAVRVRQIFDLYLEHQGLIATIDAIAHSPAQYAERLQLPGVRDVVRHLVVPHHNAGMLGSTAWRCPARLSVSKWGGSAGR